MSETEYVSADELSGGTVAAEASADFKPPCDVLIALRPFGRKEVNAPGVAKPFTAIECYTVQVTEDGDYVDIGLRDVAWEFVMRELDKSTNEAPWVVGTITKKSRAYFFIPPTVDDMKRATVAIDSFVEDRRREEATQANAEAIVGEAFPDEEPF